MGEPIPEPKPEDDMGWHVFDAERGMSVYRDGGVYHVRNDGTGERWDLTEAEWQQLLSDGPNPQEIT